MKRTLASIAAASVVPSLHWLAGYELFTRSPSTASMAGLSLFIAFMVWMCPLWND